MTSPTGAIAQPGTQRVSVPCAGCAAPVLSAPLFARPGMRGHVRCGDCCPLDGEPAPGLQERWHRRVPRPLRHATLEQISDPAARAALSGLVESWPAPMRQGGKSLRAVVLLGPAGIGKTGGAWAALTELVRRGHVDMNSILAGSEDELIVGRAKDAASRFTKPRSWQQVLSGKAVLFIDDVGHGPLDAALRIPEYRSILDVVIDRDLTLLLTTNVRAEQLEDVIGSAALSRLLPISTFAVPGVVDRRTGRARGTSSR